MAIDILNDSFPRVFRDIPEYHDFFRNNIEPNMGHMNAAIWTWLIITVLNKTQLYPFGWGHWSFLMDENATWVMRHVRCNTFQLNINSLKLITFGPKNKSKLGFDEGSFLFWESLDFQCPGSLSPHLSFHLSFFTEIHMTVQNVMEGGHNHLGQLGTCKSNSQATGL